MWGLLGRTSEKELEEMLSIELPFPLLDSIHIEGKGLIVRADLNLPIKNGKVEDETRLKLFAKTTLKELIEKEARVIILCHQGRPGKEDFLPTNIHAELLSKHSGVNFEHVPEIYGKKGKKALEEFKEGKKKYLVLQNVRFYDEELRKVSMEEHAKSKLVQTVSKYGDYYINDAFSAAHRNQASLVGFPFVMPSAAGRIMEWEMRAIKYILENKEGETIFILGGAKVEESLEVIDCVLGKEQAKKVVVGGLVANAFLDVGCECDAKKAKKLKEKYGERIVLPSTYVVDGKELSIEEVKEKKVAPKDIGEEGIKEIKELIDEANRVFLNGPLGMFEEEKYAKGTKEIFTYLARSPAFVVAGGGHTIVALNRLGILDKINHVSTGGRALLNAVMGKELPAVKALKLGKHEMSEVWS